MVSSSSVEVTDSAVDWIESGATDGECEVSWDEMGVTWDR